MLLCGGLAKFYQCTIVRIVVADDDAGSTAGGGAGGDDREAATRAREAAADAELANVSASEDGDSDGWIVDDEGKPVGGNRKKRHVIHDDA